MFSFLCLLLKISHFYFFLGDLTTAMQTPLVGEMPVPADLDLARVGLDAGPKAPLLMGGTRRLLVALAVKV